MPSPPKAPLSASWSSSALLPGLSMVNEDGRLLLLSAAAVETLPFNAKALDEARFSGAAFPSVPLVPRDEREPLSVSVVPSLSISFSLVIVSFAHALQEQIRLAWPAQLRKGPQIMRGTSSQG
mmetsp:Transcript_123326/g.245547  ORF Transcript_123326/g.245547 Transcript_123326/m.245547 type:complete len:123 (+) Transcript_123326:371-739(+)